MHADDQSLTIIHSCLQPSLTNNSREGLGDERETGLVDPLSHNAVETPIHAIHIDHNLPKVNPQKIELIALGSSSLIICSLKSKFWTGFPRTAITAVDQYEMFIKIKKHRKGYDPEMKS